MSGFDGLDVAYGFGLGFLLGLLCGLPLWFRLMKPKPESAIEKLDLTTETPEPLTLEQAARLEEMANADYSVAGTPRHVPWNRRKRELEASARQKRRQMEEWRDA